MKYPRFHPAALCGALLVLLAAGALAACQGGETSSGTGADLADRPRAASVPPAEDPRVKPHLALLERTKAMLARWDDLRADGHMAEADAIAPSLRAEVDGNFGTFAQAAKGDLGVQAQYLAASVLGFSARPDATQILQDRLVEPDAGLQGNALIALGVRADPNTSVDLLMQRIAPNMPPPVKRYAPLALANVLEARASAGQAVNKAQEQMALARLGSIVVDGDAVTRLHVVKALRALRTPGTFEYLQLLVGDPQMRVRWAAASALADLGDHRAFPDVIRLLGESPPESRHIVRDVLVTYAGNMQKRALTDAEVRSLGTGPRAWGQWYVAFRRAHGLMAPRPVPRPVGVPVGGPPRAVQPAPRPVTGAVRGG